MKKIFAISLTALFSFATIAQTTATDFNVNDCSGINHNLFNELNAGKVVVIAFVMPCGSCIGPSLSALTEVQKYATSNPGRILYYLADDVANTTCATLTSWANTSGITGVPVFSNSAVTMADYGTSGMPKIVVLSGANHAILFNQNNGINVTDFNAAIVKGLTAGINKPAKNDLKIILYPNPSTNNKTTLKYYLTQYQDLKIDVYNILGENVKNIFIEKQVAEKNEYNLDLDMLNDGVYFIKLSVGIQTQVIKFSVSH